MTRRSALALAVLAALSWVALAQADDKKKADDDKPTGFIGVQIKPADSGGIEVVEAIGGGPADKAGVKAGDVIKKVGDKEVADVEAFVEQVRKAKPGDKLKLKVTRDGKDMDVTITVGKRPSEPPPQ